MPRLDLNTVRNKIDTLDEQIQTLVTQRALLAEDVARAKYAAEENPEFYRPEREAQVLNNVKKRNQGPLPDAFMTHLFRVGTERV